MSAQISYNRQRAAKLRELAARTSRVEHRRTYLRLAFQYEAIAELEASRETVIPAARFLLSHPHPEGFGTVSVSGA